MDPSSPDPNSPVSDRNISPGRTSTSPVQNDKDQGLNQNLKRKCESIEENRMNSNDNVPENLKISNPKSRRKQSSPVNKSRHGHFHENLNSNSELSVNTNRDDVMNNMVSNPRLSVNTNRDDVMNNMVSNPRISFSVTDILDPKKFNKSPTGPSKSPVWSPWREHPAARNMNSLDFHRELAKGKNNSEFYRGGGGGGGGAQITAVNYIIISSWSCIN